MKKLLDSLLPLLFAGFFILLQLAGTSADLHGWMHGQMETSAGCLHHEEGHCGSTPADQPEDSCSETCAVMLLAGGLTLSHGYAMEPKKSRIEVLEEGGLFTPWVACHQRTIDARAPPVL